MHGTSIAGRLPLRLIFGIATLAAGFGVAGGAGAFTQKEVPAEWDVAGVGPGGRSIKLLHNSGGCRGPVRATVRGTATTVRITVVERVSVPGPNEACTDEYRLGATAVKLARPLGGRKIRGRPLGTTPVLFDLATARVPRLVGFSPWEAKRAIRLRGWKVHTRYNRVNRGRARVLGQFPAAGRTIKQKGTVRLRIGLR